MVKPIAPEQVDGIHALRSAGHAVKVIAHRIGVNPETVRRYLRADRYPPPPRADEPMNPLFDPRRDGYPDPVSLTAWICGDPHPGRRDLVALHKATA